MGLYFRRSVRVGPFRLNFSTSGIGISTGIRGFRVGTGPRGAYVHMGVNGIYYRQSLGSGAAGGRHISSNQPRLVETQQPTPLDGTVGEQREIESASVLEMRDSSSADLLDEIKSRNAVLRRWPLTAGFTAIVITACVVGEQPAAALVLAAIGAAVTYWISMQDAVRRTVAILYDLDERTTASFEALADAVMGLGQVGSLLHISSSAAVIDRKYHANASSVVTSTTIKPSLSAPPVVRSNIAVPILPAGRQRLCFFPDRLMVFDGGHVGAIAYSDLQVILDKQRWIEEGSVPNDAQVVDRTWRYTNRAGGADRRFKNNRELPILQYESIHLRSASGLNELLYASRVGVGTPIRDAVFEIAHQIRELSATYRARPYQDKAQPDTGPATGSTQFKGSEGHDSLRTGAVAEIISQRGPAWEQRLFAQALILALKVPSPSVAREPTSPPIESIPDMMRWSTARMKVFEDFIERCTAIVEKDLQTALGPPGKPGDPDLLLRAAWDLGQEAARITASTEQARQVPVAAQFLELREALSHAADQPLRAMREFGPRLLSAIDQALKSPAGSDESRIHVVLKFQLENSEKLQTIIDSIRQPIH